MPTRSALLLGRHRDRRLPVAIALRADGVVVVEAGTVPQAEAILGQLYFDVVAIDFVGVGVGIIEFLHVLHADHPDTQILVLRPPVNDRLVANLRLANLTDGRNATRPGRLAGAFDPLLQAGSDFQRSANGMEKTVAAARNGTHGRQRQSSLAGREEGRRASK